MLRRTLFKQSRHSRHTMSDSDSTEEGHESDYFPDGSATYITKRSPDAALAAGHRRPDEYTAQVPGISQLRMTPESP